MGRQREIFDLSFAADESSYDTGSILSLKF